MPDNKAYTCLVFIVHDVGELRIISGGRDTTCEDVLVAGKVCIGAKHFPRSEVTSFEITVLDYGVRVYAARWECRCGCSPRDGLGRGVDCHRLRYCGEYTGASAAES